MSGYDKERQVICSDQVYYLIYAALTISYEIQIAFCELSAIA